MLLVCVFDLLDEVLSRVHQHNANHLQALEKHPEAAPGVLWSVVCLCRRNWRASCVQIATTEAMVAKRIEDFLRGLPTLVILVFLRVPRMMMLFLFISRCMPCWDLVKG